MQEVEDGHRNRQGGEYWGGENRGTKAGGYVVVGKNRTKKKQKRGDKEIKVGESIVEIIIITKNQRPQSTEGQRASGKKKQRQTEGIPL